MAFYLVEYSPNGMADWELRIIHPLYGVAWLGLGLALSLLTNAIQRAIRAWTLRNWGLMAFSLVTVAALPVAMWKLDSKGFLAAEFALLRLAKVSGSDVSASLLAWMIHDGITAKICATLLPALLVLPARWLIIRKSTTPWGRASVALALGPVLVAVGQAAWRVGEWSTADASLLGLLVATTSHSSPSRVAHYVWPASVAVVLALGISRLLPSAQTGTLTNAELLRLAEHDLAQWMAEHAPASINRARSNYGRSQPAPSIAYWC